MKASIFVVLLFLGLALADELTTPEDQPQSTSEWKTEEPSEWATGTPAEGSTEEPSEFTTGTPTEWKTEEPSKLTTGIPAEWATGTPAEGSTEEPSEWTTATAEFTTGYPKETTTESTTGYPTDTTTEFTTGYPTDTTTESTTGHPTETTTEFTTELTSTEPSTATPTQAPTTPPQPKLYNMCDCVVKMDSFRWSHKIPSKMLFNDTDIGFTSTEECSQSLFKKCEEHCVKEFSVYTLGFDLTRRPLAPQQSKATLGERICSLVGTKISPTPAYLSAAVVCDVRPEEPYSGYLIYMSKPLSKSKQRFTCIAKKAFIFPF